MRLILLACLFSAQFVWAQKGDKKEEASQIKWYTIEEAYQLNKQNPKKIYIDFYTDWCGWCKRMDASTFKNSKVIAVMNKYYYAVKFNAETKDTIHLSSNVYTSANPSSSRASHKLALELLDNKMSFPTSVYLDETFSKIQAVPGYLDSDTMKQVLLYFGKDVFKKQSWEDFQNSTEELE